MINTHPPADKSWDQMNCENRAEKANGRLEQEQPYFKTLNMAEKENGRLEEEQPYSTTLNMAERANGTFIGTGTLTTVFENACYYYHY
jgi:hypothetical protein